jgi:two-component system chemotaxis response regulator CheY
VPRILHIDDQKLARIALQSALDPLGFEIEQADGGAEGLKKAVAGRWDLILLDVEMPEIDGPTVLRILRARDPRTPIALLTSVSSTAVLTATMRLGATSYFPKSLPPAQLRAAVAKLLKLDPPRQDPPGPRVIVHSADDSLARVLGASLPAHVQLFTEREVEALVRGCERRHPGLVLLDARTPIEGLPAVVASVRAMAPVAGIFAICDGEPGPELPQARDAIDGILPSRFDAVVGYELLYLNFLRPLVFLEDRVARAAAFSGDPAHLVSFFRTLGRQLVQRGARLERGDTLRVDLTGVPDSSSLVPMIARVNMALTAQGVQPWFDVRADHDAIKSHPALGDVFFL